MKSNLGDMTLSNLVTSALQPSSIAAISARNARSINPLKKPSTPMRAYQLGVDSAPGRETPFAEFEVGPLPSSKLRNAATVNKRAEATSGSRAKGKGQARGKGKGKRTHDEDLDGFDSEEAEQAEPKSDSKTKGKGRARAKGKGKSKRTAEEDLSEISSEEAEKAGPKRRKKAK